MAYRKLFTSGRIGTCEIKNRIIVPAFQKNYANKDGWVTQRLIDYWVERAKGGVGLILIGSAYISPESKGGIFQVGIYADYLIDGLKRLTDTVHQNGAKIGIQIQHRGRQTEGMSSGFHSVAPSPISAELPPQPRVTLSKEIPRELIGEEIKDIIKKFGEAAGRAKKAGFDVVEIHGAHGYLINEFLSPYSNKRKDEYGGSVENRERFALETISSVRKAVGDDFPLIFRISADEFIDGGRTLEDNRTFAPKLEKAGIDLISVTGGMDKSIIIASAPMDVPATPFTYLAAAIKEVVNIPVSVANKINDPELAETILEKGQADFICMARALHADPYFPKKAQEGRKEDISICIGCLEGCIDLKERQYSIGCVVNPFAGREREFSIRPTRKKKQILIIGGGPAGMEAALASSLLGNEVTLFEREEELGGQIKYSSKLPYNEGFNEITRYLSLQLKKQGIEIVTATEVTTQTVYDASPDVVILATGAVPYILPIPGVDKTHVVSFLDVLSGTPLNGDKAVIIGGNELKACQLAEYLAEREMKVILVSPFEEKNLVVDVGQRAWFYVLPRIRRNKNITFYCESSVEIINESSVSFYHKDHWEEITDVDMVVMATGTISRRELADTLIRENRIDEIYCIGDCVIPRTSLEAICEGAEVAYKISH